jgi:uncharacterized protein (DUF1015 family)
MAALFPFRAVRPVPAFAARVAAVPYDVVTADEARALALTEPLSFLHVSRAEVDLPPDTDPHDAAVYARAAANFARMRGDGTLVHDEEAAIYLYRLTMGTHVQTGIAACFSLDEYERDIIRKHERTRPDKEDDRTRHIVALRAQTGLVFLTYRSHPVVQSVIRRTDVATPLYDVAASDGVRHTIWRVEDRDAGALIAAFREIDALYIADGHHRAAAALRARSEIGGDASEVSGRLLAVAFAQDEMQVLAYNRLVADLHGHTASSLLDALRRRFAVAPGPPVPARRGDVAMYLEGVWYTIALGEPFPGTSPAEALDVSRLQTQVLEPLLGIDDPGTDARIGFVGGIRGTQALQEAVDSGRAAIAFSLHPVGVEEVMRISDAGGIMPPKSTWFEPKLRDGLLSHVI